MGRICGGRCGKRSAAFIVACTRRAPRNACRRKQGGRRMPGMDRHGTRSRRAGPPIGTRRRKEGVVTNSHEFVRPKDEAERAYLESLVREDYDRCHQGETFDDMKRRIPFSREDRGLYRDWLAVRSEEHTSELQSREKLVCSLLLEKQKTRR